MSPLAINLTSGPCGGSPIVSDLAEVLFIYFERLEALHWLSRRLQGQYGCFHFGFNLSLGPLPPLRPALPMKTRGFDRFEVTYAFLLTYLLLL